MADDTEVDRLRATLRRMIATDGECRAAIWLTNRRTDEWYEWETCNAEPGHVGSHTIWSDRDMMEYGEWTDEGLLNLRYTDLTKTKQRLEPSPWTEQELATLRSVI